MDKIPLANSQKFLHLFNNECDLLTIPEPVHTF